MCRKIFPVLLILLGMFPLQAIAEEAGQLLQEIERSFEEPLPEEGTFDVMPLPPELKPVQGLKITLLSIDIRGNSLVDEAELQKAVVPFLNKEIGFTELQQAAAAVGDVYRKKGLLSRVYIPEQEVSGDSIILQVVEANFGKVMDGGSEVSAKDMDRANKWMTARQKQGEPVRTKDIDRAILLVNDLSGVQAVGNLTRGSSETETDFLLTVKKNRDVGGMVMASNDGSYSTGEYKGTLTVQKNSPFMFGDQMMTNVSLSEGSQYVRLGYSMPVGYDGLRAAANISNMQYDVIRSLANIDAGGSSDTAQLALKYPIIRAKKANLYISGSYNIKQFENKVTGNVTSDYEVRNFELQLSGNRFDRWWGGGALQGSLTMTSGTVDLAGSPNAASDAATVDTDGSYTKFLISVERQQRITKTIKALLRYKNQTASKNLDSSDRFSLGGSSSVRAYPSGELSGSEGHLTQAEVHWQPKKHSLFAVFYDVGEITLNKENDFLLAPTENQFRLEGYGLYWNWNNDKNLFTNVTYANRFGSNPNANPDGSDKDGTLIRERVWASVTYRF